MPDHIGLGTLIPEVANDHPQPRHKASHCPAIRRNDLYRLSRHLPYGPRITCPYLHVGVKSVSVRLAANSNHQVARKWSQCPPPFDKPVSLLRQARANNRNTICRRSPLLLQANSRCFLSQNIVTHTPSFLVIPAQIHEQLIRYPIVIAQPCQ